MTPFEYLVWDAGDCAEYLKESRDYFLSHTRYKDGFPSEIPGKPKRWRAIEVAGWALGIPANIPPIGQNEKREMSKIKELLSA